MTVSPPPYVPKYRTVTDLMVVHCSATRPTQDVGVREITQWHVQRGFDTVGYHYVIRRNGEMETGRPEKAIGAHAKGHNAKSIGVCLVGGVDGTGKPANNFTDAQFVTLRRLLDELHTRYPDARILGHRDLSPDRNGDGIITPNEFTKVCPSFDVAAWLKQRQ